MSNLNAALHYAKQGFHILPTHYKNQNNQCSCGKGLSCRSIGKHPWTQNGVLDATTDVETIKRWWRKGNWNVAFRTGQQSGIFVLDVDAPNALEGLEPLPETMVAKTPRGSHHYFVWEEGITNRAKLYGLPIDVRGVNGYVVAPPSLGYEWINPVSIVSAPPWLTKAIRL